MDSPHFSDYIRQVIRCLLIFVLGYGSARSAHSRTAGPVPLIDALLTVDAQFLGDSQIAAVRSKFDALAREAAVCAETRMSGTDRARCVVLTLFASDPLEAVEEPGEPRASTVTSALASHRGNCAALAALALALAERIGVPMEAVVFPRHVVVRSPANRDQVFELLDQGATLTLAQLRIRLGADGAHDTRVRPDAFPAYYLDNLAVRFAEAGDADRAEATFTQAIEASPRLARVRFNYGTYLLGKDRLEAAEEQLRRAVRLESRNAPAWANLGVVAARLGDTTEARRCFQRALKIDPRNRTATDNLRALGPEQPTPPR